MWSGPKRGDSWYGLKPLSEIAEEMGCSLSAVQSLHCRAIRKMKRERCLKLWIRALAIEMRRKSTMKKFVLAVIATLTLAVGCRAQVPPASGNQGVAINWTAPPTTSWGSCTTANPVHYAVYRSTKGGASCAANTDASWAEITTAANRPTGTNYTDTNVAGQVACYNVETVCGTANSDPSNTAGPFAPSAAPTSPGTVSGAVQTAMAPQLQKLGPVPSAKTLAHSPAQKGAKELASVTGLKAQLR